MTGWVGSAGNAPDLSFGQIDDWERAALTRVEQITELSAAVARLRATRTSVDGRVQVTVDSQGRLRDLRFSRDSEVLGPDKLAAAVLATVEQAIGDVTEQAALLADRASGLAAEALRAHLRKRDMR